MREAEKQSVAVRPSAIYDAVKAEKKFLEHALNNLKDIFFVFDLEKKFLKWNTSLTTVSGYNDSEIAGMNPIAFFDGDDAARIEQAIQTTISEGSACIEAVFVTKEGRHIPYQFTGSLLKDENGAVIGICGTGRDITESEQRQRLMDRIFEQSGEAIVVTNSRNEIIAVNSAFTRLTGYSREDAIGCNPRILQSGRESEDFYTAMWESLLTNDYWQGEIWDKRKDGSFYPKWLTISVIRNEEGEIINYIGGFSDITERKATEDKIRHLAHHDPLTNLPNRFSLFERLSQALEQAKRSDQILAVMFIDLDRFKNINDSLGHHIGDLLLIQVAIRLKDAVRHADIVARLGGDEFVVVLPAINSGVDAAHLAGKIVRTISTPFMLAGCEVHTTPSIGISVFPHDGDSVDLLVKNADTAMYHAKSRGRNNFQFFTRGLHHASEERLSLENDLVLALEKNEFFLHYQPQMEVSSGRVVGVEALVRWQHPHHGLITSDKFIPIAEESGHILPLGEKILEMACGQLAAWLHEGVPAIRMSVNLSAKQFLQKDLPEIIARILSKSAMDPRLLDLEIAEKAAMEHPEGSYYLLRGLKETGVGLTIDNFGTGCSSISYLKMFPVMRLKIGRQLIESISRKDDQAIVAAAISLAHTLGKEVIAEGVETQAEVDFLTIHGCDMIQGFFSGRPLPPEEAAKFIRTNLGEYR